MKDVCEEAVSAPAPQSRRRTGNGGAHQSHKANSAAPKKSLSLQRVFSDASQNPFDQLEWERRTAEITDDAGKVIFKQENVFIFDFVTKKYLYLFKK